MATSEIEKLERRYAENPHGLTFAPLAEMYRKSGDLGRALELLGAGIERHPEYIPARIVLGRCHLDADAVVEAEQAFAHVLTLDSENVIALKALADIGERQARYDDAVRWLQTLLSVDRNNEMAREQLARLEAARTRTESDVSTSPDAGADAEPDYQAGVEAAGETAPAPVVEVLAASTVESAPEPVPEPVPVTELGDAVDEEEKFSTIGAEPAPAEADAALAAETTPLVLDEVAVPREPVELAAGVELTEEITLDGAVEPLAGLVGPESAELRDDLVHGGEDEFHIETADDLVLRPAGASEFQMPDASQELIAAKPEPDPLAGIVPSDGLDSGPVNAATADAVADGPTAETAAGSETEATPDAPSAADIVSPADEVLTAVSGATTVPTADVPDPVADVSPAVPPEAQREPAVEEESEPEPPPEPDLIVTETMAEVLIQQGYTGDALRIYRELERRNTSDERLRERRAALEARMARSAKGAPSYAARDTGGQSVGTMLRNLLAARLSATASASADLAAEPSSHRAAPSAAGAPTRPAADTLSLSAVFGEEASPVPPAAPAGSARNVSFDEFFGAPVPSRGAPGTRPPASKDDDLDQFHAWLQNLKR